MNEMSERQLWDHWDNVLRSHFARLEVAKRAFSRDDVNALSCVVNYLYRKHKKADKATVSESVIDLQDALVSQFPRFNGVDLAERVRCFSDFEILLDWVYTLDDDAMPEEQVVRWSKERPGKWVSEDGEWVMHKEGRKYMIYSQGEYDRLGRFLRL